MTGLAFVPIWEAREARTRAAEARPLVFAVLPAVDPAPAAVRYFAAPAWNEPTDRDLEWMAARADPAWKPPRARVRRRTPAPAPLTPAKREWIAEEWARIAKLSPADRASDLKAGEVAALRALGR